jgi:sugar phosphate permease
VILFQGFSFPALHVMISRWAPVEERSLISSVVYAGGNRKFPFDTANQ